MFVFCRCYVMLLFSYKTHSAPITLVFFIHLMAFIGESNETRWLCVRFHDGNISPNGSHFFVRVCVCSLLCTANLAQSNPAKAKLENVYRRTVAKLVFYAQCIQQQTKCVFFSSVLPPLFAFVFNILCFRATFNCGCQHFSICHFHISI